MKFNVAETPVANKKAHCMADETFTNAANANAFTAILAMSVDRYNVANRHTLLEATDWWLNVQKRLAK